MNAIVSHWFQTKVEYRSYGILPPPLRNNCVALMILTSARPHTMAGGREVEGEAAVLLLRSSEVKRQEKHGPAPAKKSKAKSRASPLQDELPSISAKRVRVGGLMDTRRIR